MDVCCLHNEIHQVIRTKELQLPKYEGNSPQLCYRRILVDWLALISERLNMSHGILHLSVTYMDLVMEKWEFSKRSQLNLLALCCLWIAAKLDEMDNLIPTVNTLQTFLEKSYYQYDFLQMELSIMQCLDWRLLLPTSVHFLDYYMQFCMDENDMHAGYKLSLPEKYRKFIHKYASYFLEVSLQHHTFNELLRSLVASAAIATSRTCLKITPSWPASMWNATGYSEEDIVHCVNTFLKIHQDDQSRAKNNYS